jgi:excisionase family DNA binding protein
MRRMDTVRDIVGPTMSQEGADALSDLYRHMMTATGDVTVSVSQEGTSLSPVASVRLPAEVVSPLVEVLQAMAEGHSVSVVPRDAEFTTAEAAEFLGVSRPFVVKEMDQGRLPHRKVGSHRRVLHDDLTAYAAQMRSNQNDALQRMSDNAKELGLEY